MVRTIDVHNHLFPMEWVDYLEKRTKSPRMEQIREHQGTVKAFFSHDARCSTITLPGHYDPEVRIKDLDRCGIDTQLLSLTVPSLEELPVEEGVRWARKINDYFAEVCHKYPGRFYACATLPLQDVAEALKELDRSYRELNVKGITMYSHVNFNPISSPQFQPIYARAEKYELPIFIHPGVPFTDQIMRDHGLTRDLYGFTLDTSTAVMSLVWRGILEKHPGLKIIHAHLGGIVPYLVQRMEDCWRWHSKDMGLELREAPSEYYKRQVYPDTMSAYLPAMRCCLDFVGSKHMCMGTDYPHGIGNWEQAIASVKRLGLPEEDTNNILGGNAARIFKIE